MSRDLYPIEREMLQSVSEICAGLYDENPPSNKPWTKGVKDALAELARNHGFRSFYAGDPQSLEWLWDMTWLDVGEAWRNFRGVYLACEIEWNAELGEHLHDFMKLVVAESKYRLFVCAVHGNPDWIERRFRELEDASAEAPGKRYLVIGTPPAKPEGALPFRAWTT
jgi:hypothetical protein